MDLLADVGSLSNDMQERVRKVLGVRRCESEPDLWSQSSQTVYQLGKAHTRPISQLECLLEAGGVDVLATNERVFCPLARSRLVVVAVDILSKQSHLFEAFILEVPDLIFN